VRHRKHRYLSALIIPFSRFAFHLLTEAMEVMVASE